MKYFIFLTIFFINFCKKWEEHPRPPSVFREAKYIKKIHIWEYKTEKEEILWYEDGKIYRKAEKNGELYHGKYEQYFKNGKISQEGIYENGYRTGIWKYYFFDGKIYLILEYKTSPVNEKIFYPNSIYGNENGNYKRFYPDGQLEEEGTYLAGKYHGKRIQYYRNGNIRMIGYYNQGIKKGEWIIFNSAKKVIRKEIYKNNQLIKIINEF